MRDTPFALKLCRRLLQVAREVFQDFKYTLRLWASGPWHAGLAITALAIGIGANTGVFSVVDALLLRSLPISIWAASRRIATLDIVAILRAY